MDEMKLKKLLMSYRMSLPLPPEYDSRKSLIQLFIETDGESGNTKRYVKTAIPCGRNDDVPDEKSEEVARILWKEKYHEDMPDDVDVERAENILATILPCYDGPTKLTDAEWNFVKSIARPACITLDILWFIVEGLGWRPGVPVSEDDEKWLAVWVEEIEIIGNIDSVRDFVGMFRAPSGVDLHWVPPAVARFISLYEKGGMTNE